MKRRNFLKGLLTTAPVVAIAGVSSLKAEEKKEEKIEKKVLNTKLLCIDQDVLPEFFVDLKEPDATYVKVKDKK